VLDANPLDDIKNTNTIRYVMKNGRVYEGNTLNEIWPRQRALPKQWWMTHDAITAAGGRRGGHSWRAVNTPSRCLTQPSRTRPRSCAIPGWR
jgi:hypothetical protein